MTLGLSKQVASQFHSLQILPGIILIIAMLIGCKNNTDLSTAEAEGTSSEVEQQTGNSSSDAALAIAFANSWLIEPK